MGKKLAILILYVFIAFLILESRNALSKPKPAIGIMIGEPTGPTGKLYFDQRISVDIFIGFSLINSLDFHSDILFAFPNIGNIHNLYLYLGGGIKLRDFQEDEKRNKDYIGIRMPIGSEFIWRKYNLSLFGEIAPILKIIGNTGLDFDLSIGIRYIF